ncbi:phosphoadenylyl-sulfate reductase [Jiella mangrovi]|nr:phosphoadenylyl-sulfate reductase [Jiella mangrovi]
MVLPVETTSRMELQRRAQALSLRFEGADASVVLKAALTELFVGRIGLVSSFGTEAAILLHMVSRIDPYAPVVFLDTWKHFAETLAYRDQLIERFGLCNVQIVTPRPAQLEADDPDGDLHARNADLCCHVRKTLPMLSALRPFDCWITGRKRHQARTRAGMQLFEGEERRLKLNPLIDWSADDIAAYFRENDLPEHPLKSAGYLSVGCLPCTRAVKPGEDARAGRWAGTDKTECGIHIVDGKIARAVG